MSVPTASRLIVLLGDFYSGFRIDTPVQPARYIYGVMKPYRSCTSGWGERLRGGRDEDLSLLSPQFPNQHQCCPYRCAVWHKGGVPVHTIHILNAP